MTCPPRGEQPRLQRVPHPAVARGRLRFVHHLGPREVEQGDLAAQLALVDVHRVLPGAGSDLVGGGDHCVEALLASDVEVVLHLCPAQLPVAGLDLHRPGALPPGAGGADHPVGDGGGLVRRERGLQAGLHGPAGGVEAAGQPARGGPHAHHRGQQRGGGALLLFLTGADPGDGEHPRCLPGLPRAQSQRRWRRHRRTGRLGLAGTHPFDRRRARGRSCAAGERRGGRGGRSGVRVVGEAGAGRTGIRCGRCTR